jgi:uncharacterized protein (DUF305 family)
MSMRENRLPILARALGAALTMAACTAAATPAPGPTPAAGNPQLSADTVARNGYTAADVLFMQNMIGHHRQALVMAELVPLRTQRPDFQLLAERITLSQESEIEQMQRWLQQRGEAIPAPEAHAHAAMGHGTLMPGMLSDAELRQLSSARGTAFERLFLELMIKHHEGALQMVKDLYATPASGQEPELFILASDVDADQNAEIRRMQALLAQLQ